MLFIELMLHFDLFILGVLVLSMRPNDELYESIDGYKLKTVALFKNFGANFAEDTRKDYQNYYCHIIICKA